MTKRRVYEPTSAPPTPEFIRIDICGSITRSDHPRHWTEKPKSGSICIHHPGGLDLLDRRIVFIKSYEKLSD